MLSWKFFARVNNEFTAAHKKWAILFFSKRAKKRNGNLVIVQTMTRVKLVDLFNDFYDLPFSNLCTYYLFVPV